MKDSKEIIKNISLLYELSLAIGTSLDLEENSRHFMSVLMRRMNIICGGVWLRNNILDETYFTEYQLAYGYPKARSNHQIISENAWLEGKFLAESCFLIDELNENTKPLVDIDNWLGNTCVIFRLKGCGFIQMYFSSTDNQPVTKSKIYPLGNIMDKFALSINACIAYQKSLLEMEKRQSIQKELIISNEKYESVVRNIAEGLVITDLNGYVVFVNDSMCELCGFSREEIIESEGYKLMIPETYWDLYAKKLGKRKKGESEIYEFPLKRKDGELRWVSVSATPYTNSDGAITGSLAAITDITEKKNAQEKIIESQRKLQLILDTSLDAIVTVNEESCITDWNQSAEITFGYTKAEALGQPLRDLIIPQHMAAAHQRGMEHYMETGEGPVLNKRIELTAVRKSGEEFPVELTISPIKIHNKYFFSSFLRDITKRKQNENALIEAKQMAEQARNVERQFLAHMSHEIRTPMNAVIGMTYLLEQSSLSQEQEEYIQALKFSADSLMAIISDILDLSKIEAGELELEHRSFSLHQLLKSLQHTYKFKMQEKDVSVELNIDDKIENQVVGDKTRVGQILGNLLNNASKFTSEGYIGVNAILERTEGTINWIRFQVYDTGIGIAKEHLSIIFSSFKQAKVETHGEYGGTGLGLSIVKQLIELQDGTIEVNSELGKGTMFEVLLPFEDAGIAANGTTSDAEEQEQEQEQLSNLTILIAEDNPINQKLITTILMQWDCTFDLAGDGVEALALSEKKEYNLIFMDINMPRMNGYETVVALKKDSNNPNYHTPIITLTAAALHEERKRMFEVGVSDFITKPFSPKLLHDTILRWAKKSVLKPIEETTPIEPVKATIKGDYDLSYLNKFSRNNHAFVIEMVQMFLEHNPKNVEQLEAAIGTEKWSEAQDLAHQMKSTYGTLGMTSYQEWAKEIELGIKNSTLKVDDLMVLVKKIQVGSPAIYEALKTEI